MVVNHAYWQRYLKDQLRPCPSEPDTDRHSRRSIETVKTVGTVTGSGSNSSNNQKLISRNTRKSPSKLFILQLDETGNEQEKQGITQNKQACQHHGTGMIILGVLCQET